MLRPAWTLALLAAGAAAAQWPAALPERYVALWQSAQEMRPGMVAQRQGEWDPWRVNQRLGALSELMDATAHCLWEPNDVMNPFWGFYLQTAWQYVSGRHLSANSSDVGGAISTASWWGVHNYFLVVMPYMAAVEQGLLPSVRVAPPRNAPTAPDDFVSMPIRLLPARFEDCLGDEVFARACAAWRTFIRELVQSRTLWCASDLAFDPSARLLERDRLTGLMWDAHQLHLRSATPSLEALRKDPRLMEPMEQHFSYAFAMVVADVLADTHFYMCLDNIVELQAKVMPPRMLGAMSDRVADLPARVGTSVCLMASAASVDERLGGRIFPAVHAVWRFHMCSFEMRQHGVRLLMHALAAQQQGRLADWAAVVLDLLTLPLHAWLDTDCRARQRDRALIMAMDSVAAALVAFVFCQFSRILVP